MEITYQQLQERIPTLVGYSAENDEINRYLIFLKQAQKWLKKNITGLPLFAAIEASSDADVKELCVDIICYRGYLDAIPFDDLIQTGSGFAVSNNANLAPASKDRVASLKSGIVNMFTQCVDDLIAYLEVTTSFHTDWKKSKTYSLLNDTLISTITEFNKYANFKGNRLDFIAAHPIMIDAIKLHLAQYISQEYCTELIGQLNEDNVTDSNKPIIEEVKLAYANFVVGEREKAINYANRVRAFMIEHINDFPTFAQSSIYVAYTTRMANASENEATLNAC